MQRAPRGLAGSALPGQPRAAWRWWRPGGASDAVSSHNSKLLCGYQSFAGMLCVLCFAWGDAFCMGTMLQGHQMKDYSSHKSNSHNFKSRVSNPGTGAYFHFSKCPLKVQISLGLGGHFSRSNFWKLAVHFWIGRWMTLHDVACLCYMTRDLTQVHGEVGERGFLKMTAWAPDWEIQARWGFQPISSPLPNDRMMIRYYITRCHAMCHGAIDDRVRPGLQQRHCTLHPGLELLHLAVDEDAEGLEQEDICI